jgi:hypothetical protein
MIDIILNPLVKIISGQLSYFIRLYKKPLINPAMKRKIRLHFDFSIHACSQLASHYLLSEIT